MGDATDLELVSAVIDGDERAFRTLYARHTPAMYGVALRLLARRVPDAEDAVQEAWLRGVRRLRTFRGDSLLRTWLVGISVRCALEIGRQSTRQRSAPADEPVVPARAPHRELDLEAAIAALPDGYRQIVVLHDIEGHTHAEIAALVGIDEGTSKSQLSRARRHLRQTLNGIEAYIHGS
jgi:RNA polymerase sigma-70 factor, ECF subfamily